MATRYFRTFAVGAALLMLLAACSGDDESGDSGAASRPEPVTDRAGRVAFDVGEQGGGAATGVDQATFQEDPSQLGRA